LVNAVVSTAGQLTCSSTRPTRVLMSGRGYTALARNPADIFPMFIIGEQRQMLEHHRNRTLIWSDN
jgi:hypothetical protein